MHLWAYGFEPVDTPFPATFPATDFDWGTDWIDLMHWNQGTPFIQIGDILW